MCTRNFLRSSVLFIFFIVFQLDSFAQLGCSNVDAGSDVTVDCNDTCTTLEASIIAVPLVTTSSYVIETPACPLPPITGGTPTSLTIDDRWSPVIDIPFDFSFYQNDYNQLVVGANGQISFDISLADSFNGWSIDPGDQIPLIDTNFPFNTIYGAYHDLDPSVDPNPNYLNYFVTGDAPYRVFVMNFDMVPHFGCNELKTSQQIVLYETLNVIEVNIIDKPVCATWNDGLAVIGLMGNDLTEFAVPPGRNTGQWTATNETWRFIPDGTPTVNASFEWRDSTGTVISTDVMVEVCPQTTSTYTAALVYQDMSGSTIEVTDDVVVNVDNALDVNVGPDQEFCIGESYVITAEVGIDPSLVTFLWNTGETTQSITVTETGTYSVEVTYFDCTGSDSTEVTFNEDPIIELGDDIETCFENPVILDATPSNYPANLATYVWSLDGVVIQGAIDPTLTVTAGGTYSVEVTVGICSSIDSINISPRTDLEVSLGDDFRSCPNEPQTLQAVTSENGITYEWQLNGETIEGATGNTLDVMLDENAMGTQVYTVIITKGECAGTADINIELYEVANCVISQGISPNGSPGFNDQLDLEFLSDRAGGIRQLQIYNRLGSLVYQRNNYVNEWFGQSDDGNELPSGTYFYVIDLASEDPVYGAQATGWIYLNRDAN